TIHGVQDARVQTCSKHYIANKEETQRSNTNQTDGTRAEAISANVHNRTIHELYLWSFADAIRAGTTSVMCSYNRLNQTYSCENSHILTKLLHEELGFQGYTVSDWFATHSTSDYINAGLYMGMPGVTIVSCISTLCDSSGSILYFGDRALEAVSDGTVSEARIDQMVRNIMTPYSFLG
ncbi:hypothetical protein LZ31DRAFT_478142, partial [Colletotrichum somersetense]